MQQQKRFLALDVFRGMTICFMIIVNTSPDEANTFPPLLHAHWHGFTPTDLVFPSFLFAVGNAMSFVMRKWETLSTPAVLAKIFKRTLLIFILGYLMYWFPFVRFDRATNHFIFWPFAKTRVFGVLQRIALAYCFASLMIYFFKLRTTIIISALILLVYWAVMFYFGDAADPLSLHGNAVLKLDLFLLGPDHLYHGEGVPFDPEGFLSTFPAIVNVVGGYWAGQFLQQREFTYEKLYERLTKLMLAGFVLLVLAHFWNYAFPINKKLWTSSFVLQTVGLDCLIISAIVFIVDIKHKTAWTPFFQVFGKNPLFIYLLSEVLVILWNVFRFSDHTTTIYKWLYVNIFSHGPMYLGAFLQAVLYMLLCWSVGYWMDKRKIYVRV
jgi:predicted acyltransferase